MNSKQKNRTPRSVEKREQEVRQENWTPPNLLPDPLPKDGWSFKWVRIKSMGQDDPMNYSKKLREGWEAVPIEEVPEMEHLVLDPNPRFEGKIEVGGLLLCRMPSKMASQRNQHYVNQSRDSIDSVDQSVMWESNPRMPIDAPERSTQVRFGSGS